MKQDILFVIIGLLVLFILLFLANRWYDSLSKPTEGYTNASLPNLFIPNIPNWHTSTIFTRDMGTGTAKGIKYVKIIGGNKPLHISQLAVFDSFGNNVALTSRPSSDSVGAGCNNMTAIDGHLEARPYRNITHTQDRTRNYGDAWYQLELSNVTDVMYVVVYHRVHTDCCSDRIGSGYKVLLMDANQKVRFTSKNLSTADVQIIQTDIIGPNVDYNHVATGGENQNAVLQCPQSEVLTDALVSYGKWDGNGNGVKVSKNYITLFGTNFQQKNSDVQNINNRSFQQDPLWGTYKQFEVKYRCEMNLPAVAGCKFDPAKYKQQIPELQNAPDDNARQNFLAYGMGTVSDMGSNTFANIAKSPCGSDDPNCVFDPFVYADLYDDLKKAFGYDTAKLTQHYKTFGIIEGRTICPPPVKQVPGTDMYGLRKWEFAPSMHNWHAVKQNGFAMRLYSLGFSQHNYISITFLIRLDSTNSEWRDIFHFTNTGGDGFRTGTGGRLGDRVPFAEVVPNTTQVAFRFGSDTGGGNTQIATQDVGLKTVTMLTIVFDKNDETGKDRVTTYLFDKQHITKDYGYIVKRIPSTKLYIGDPWYVTDGINIKNFTLWDGALKLCDVEHLYQQYSMNGELQ
jgi:hypothetical protein